VVLSAHRPVLASRTAVLPSHLHGVVYANELLDAMPTHVVTMMTDGLCESFVAEENGRLTERIAEPSTPQLSAALSGSGLTPAPGWRGEVSLAADEWMTQLASSLDRGFAMLVDYGHDADELADARHRSGTLMAYEGHRVHDGFAACLESPGERDITAHVNLTAVTRAAERGGLRTLARVDQTYFLLGVGAADWMTEASGDPLGDLRRRLALKTLLVPGGLGSTMKVLIFGKDVGDPPLRATSWGGRLT
jgi:SAM-dependent MidA family methyltransferase